MPIIFGSYGTLRVNEQGDVIDYYPSDEATADNNYCNVRHVDLDHYVATYGEVHPHIDILEAGLWHEVDNGTLIYESPAVTHESLAV